MLLDPAHVFGVSIFLIWKHFVFLPVYCQLILEFDLNFSLALHCAFEYCFLLLQLHCNNNLAFFSESARVALTHNIVSTLQQ